MLLRYGCARRGAERWFAQHDPEGVAFEYPVNGTVAELYFFFRVRSPRSIASSVFRCSDVFIGQEEKYRF
jgi:hypothetical protein